MNKKLIAVMHVTAAQFQKLANLCTRVIGKLTEFSGDYTAPLPPVADLTTENGKLISLIAQSKGNTQKKDERDEQAEVVFEMLQAELIYVNGIAKGNKVLIDKSGFDSGKEPVAHGIPGTPAIKKMEDGAEPKSAKIFLVRPLQTGVRYTVQIIVIDIKGEDPHPLMAPTEKDDFDIDSLPWVNTLEGVSSRELLLTDLKRAKDIAVRVRAVDGSKKSGWSDPFLFLPR